MKLLFQFALLYAVSHAAPMVCGDSDFVLCDGIAVSEKSGTHNVPGCSGVVDDDKLLASYLDLATLHGVEYLPFVASGGFGPRSIQFQQAGVERQSGVYVIAERSHSGRYWAKPNPLSRLQRNSFGRISNRSPLLIVPRLAGSASSRVVIPRETNHGDQDNSCNEANFGHGSSLPFERGTIGGVSVDFTRRMNG